ncbi:alcohol dehydrogenase [Cryobacterium roopkundense]|uniref:2-desacetyl-2-hydroxyethyl bacteriochlorophyllide A dehydrogenase n=1 Tax=Cryobacterium roopkundense TaxID=1001240 RepID=A0A099JLA7_9MICO|nr:alcohol dehydrogenase catalytic domain-containing protein [Cryobacterium roopkundense]KGJ79104.1 alcohol dehydrogenase [Cryobacterium roopkundense]MBB5643279.1 2-desacetyl-2-hydroxyethyl bacteriochlorophyllide A dehydrogenase [Cryobacterium roopkundense]
MNTVVLMKRVVVRADEIVLVDAPVPRPLPGEALVEMTVSGVCGSDTHAAHGRHPFVPLPYFPGHEVVGIVRELGADTSLVSVGDRVTVEPTLPCWTCKMCRTERSNLCENLRFFGCGYEQGGMADFFTVPANRLHVVPAELSDLQAALIEPLATPVHAVRLSGGVREKAVVIIGAGTIGLLVLAAARHAGARTIVMTDMLASKRERAARLGADAVVDATGPDPVTEILAALGESADVVFDCVAIQSTLDQAIQLASRAGTVMIVGVPARAVLVPLPQVQDHQLRIQGSATYLPEDYAEAIEIIRSGEIRVDDFVTSRFPLTEVAEAFAASSGGEEVKVVVTR